MSDPARTETETAPRNRLGNAAATMLNPPAPSEEKKEPQLELKRRPSRRPAPVPSPAATTRPAETPLMRAVPHLTTVDDREAAVEDHSPEVPAAADEPFATREAEDLSDVAVPQTAQPAAPMTMVRPQTDPERGRGRPRRAEVDEDGNVVPRTGRAETSVTMPSGLRDQWFGYASAQSFSKSEVLMDAFDLVADDLADLAATARTRIEPQTRRGSMFYRPPAPGEKGAHALVSAPLRLHASNLEIIDQLAAEHRLNRSQLVSLVLREFFARNGAE